jgi:hypothetical protein
MNRSQNLLSAQDYTVNNKQIVKVDDRIDAFLATITTIHQLHKLPKAATMVTSALSCVKSLTVQT